MWLMAFWSMGTLTLLVKNRTKEKLKKNFIWYWCYQNHIKKIEVETESTIVAIRVLGAFNFCTNCKAREGVVVDSETCSAELIKCVWKWEKQSKLNFKVLNFDFLYLGFFLSCCLLPRRLKSYQVENALFPKKINKVIWEPWLLLLWHNTKHTPHVIALQFDYIKSTYTFHIFTPNQFIWPLIIFYIFVPWVSFLSSLWRLICHIKKEDFIAPNAVLFLLMGFPFFSFSYISPLCETQKKQKQKREGFNLIHGRKIKMAQDHWKSFQHHVQAESDPKLTQLNWIIIFLNFITIVSSVTNVN